MSDNYRLMTDRDLAVIDEIRMKNSNVLTGSYNGSMTYFTPD